MEVNFLDHYFKSERRYTTLANFGNEETGINIPDCLGQYVVFHFLNVVDTWSVRAVSQTFNSWARNAISCRTSLWLDSEPKLEDENLAGLISTIAKLKALNLQYCPRIQSPIIGETLCSSLRNLESLTLRHCKSIEPNFVAKLLKECINLKELDSDKISQASVDVMVVTNQKLRILKVNGSCELFTDKALQVLSMAQWLRQLEVIELEGCKISTDGLRLFLSKLTHKRVDGAKAIQILNMSNCAAVSSRGLAEIFETYGCPATRLVMKGIRASDAFICTLASKAYKDLEELVLSDCSGLKSRRALYSFANSQLLRRIKVLEMCGCNYISSNDFCKLLFAATNLKGINLSYSAYIDDNVLLQISRSCRNLEELKLRSCEKITDQGVGFIAKGCESITSLDFASCTRLTDSGVSHIAHNCVQLEKLGLFCCYMVSDQGVEKLSTGCKKLESIDLSWCYKISSISLANLVRACIHLDELHIEGCDQIPDFEIQNLIHISRCLTYDTVFMGKNKNLRPSKPKIIRRAESAYSMKSTKGDGDQRPKRSRRPKEVIHQVSLIHSSSKPISPSTDSYSISLPVQYSRLSRQDSSESLSFRKEHYVSRDQLEKRASTKKNPSGRRLWGYDEEDFERFRAFSIREDEASKDDSVTILESKKLGSPNSTVSGTSTEIDSGMFEMDEVERK